MVTEQPRVLVVDDEAQIAQAVALRLEAAGYDVMTAADGQQGLDLAFQSHPDVVVMDIQMPTMDGLTALSRIRANPQTRSLPIITLSACSGAKDRALALGAQYFLEKPYNAKTLLAAIDASVTKSPSTENLQ